MRNVRGSSDSIVIAGGLAALIFASWLPLPARAQTDPVEDTSVTVTRIEGPKEGDLRGLFAVGEGTAWIFLKQEILKVEPQGNRLVTVGRIEEIKIEQLWMVAGGGSLWIVGEAHKVDGIHRIDPTTGNCIAAIALQQKRGPISSGYGLGSLWVLDELDGTIVRIDPNTNQVAATFNVGKGPWAHVQIGDDAVWVMGSENGVMKRIDPRLNKVVEEFSVGKPQKNGFFASAFGRGGSYSFSYGEGSLWVSDIDDKDNGRGGLVRIDPNTHERVATFKYLGAPTFWKGFAWVSNWLGSRTGNLVIKIDPKTNKLWGRMLLPVERTPFGGSGTEPVSLLADNDSLWVFSEGGRLLIRRIQLK